MHWSETNKPTTDTQEVSVSGTSLDVHVWSWQSEARLQTQLRAAPPKVNFRYPEGPRERNEQMYISKRTSSNSNRPAGLGKGRIERERIWGQSLRILKNLGRISFKSLDGMEQGAT